jgi:hypothetical protein
MSGGHSCIAKSRVSSIRSSGGLLPKTTAVHGLRFLDLSSLGAAGQASKRKKDKRLSVSCSLELWVVVRRAKGRRSERGKCKAPARLDSSDMALTT